MGSGMSSFRSCPISGQCACHPTTTPAAEWRTQSFHDCALHNRIRSAESSNSNERKCFTDAQGFAKLVLNDHRRSLDNDESRNALRINTSSKATNPPISVPITQIIARLGAVI